MSDEVPTLTDTVGEATVTTTLYPDGTQWISTVRGGPRDSYASVMDRKAGDIHTLHAAVLAELQGA